MKCGLDVLPSLWSRHAKVLGALREMDVPASWFPIVDSMCHVIGTLRPVMQPVSISRMLGGMSVQGGFPQTAALHVISCAEKMSARVCEVTGRRGRLGRAGSGDRRCLAPEVQADFVVSPFEAPVDQTVAEIQARRRKTVVDPFIRRLEGIPNGYADLVDAALSALERAPWIEHRRFDAWTSADGLVAVLEPESQEGDAVCAFVAHLSRSVDRESGMLRWRE